VGFDFGLSFHHYAFVSVGNFCDPRPWHHVVPRTQVVNVYRNTTVINNYRVNNGTIVNNGVGRETIAQRNPNNFRQVKVQQASFAGGGAAADHRISRVDKRGNDLVVYRPQLPKDPPVKPSVVQNRMANQARVARAENNTPGVGNTAVPRTGRSNVGDGGRGDAVPATPRANVGGNEPRNSGGQTPRVERDARTPSEPRSTPQRVPQERNRSGETPRNGGQSVARLNEAPSVQQSPQVAPRAQSPANVPSPRVERQAVPQARSVPENRAPVVTAPNVSRNSATPYMSPRYNEQYNSPARTYVAPAHPATPTYSAPAAPAPHSVAPSVGRGGGGAVEHGGGGGGGRNEGGGRGGDGGGGGRGGRNH